MLGVHCISIPDFKFPQKIFSDPPCAAEEQEVAGGAPLNALPSSRKGGRIKTEAEATTTQDRGGGGMRGA